MDLTSYFKDNTLDTTTLQKEITYGQNYRNSILLHNKKSASILENQTIRKEIDVKSTKQWIFSRKITKNSCKFKKLSLLERSALTQNEYMRVLSVPRRIYRKSIVKQRKTKKKMKKQHKLCSPNINRLSQPNKRLVLETWRQYQDLLAPEVLVRFNNILHYDYHRLELDEARCYFKQLKRKKKQCKRKLRRKMMCKTKKTLPKWLTKEIKNLSTIICNFIKEETLFALNFEQLLISDEILKFLINKRVIKEKPERNTKNYYKRTVNEICDKLSVWFDNFEELVELKPSKDGLITSEISIPEKVLVQRIEEVPSSSSEEEDEDEEREDEDEEDEFVEDVAEAISEENLPFLPQEQYDLVDRLYTRKFDGTESSESESEFKFFDQEDEGFDYFTRFDEDSLDKLIKILSNCSNDYLDSYLNEKLWPTIKNRDVLNKLKQLRDGIIEMKEKTKPNQLEELMIKWAKRNQPEKVDERVLEKIHITSRVIADLLDYREKSDKNVQESLSSLDEEEEEDDGEGGRKRKRKKSKAESIPDETEEIEEEEEEEEGEDLEFFKEPSISSTDADHLIIHGHKPPITHQHEPNKICCLSLKIWSIWLMEITHNLHNWTKWLVMIIKQIRNYSTMIRNPETKLYKNEWRQFCNQTQDKIITWRQYSQHVQQLSDEIIENFTNKSVICCPACLYNHKIPNVVQAHETIQALVEAINCAAYWHRCLDQIVDKADSINDIDLETIESSSDSSSETTIVEILETPLQSSDESLYEIEEITRK